MYVDDNINEDEEEDEEEGQTLQDAINDEEIIDFANMDDEDPFGLMMNWKWDLVVEEKKKEKY